MSRTISARVDERARSSLRGENKRIIDAIAEPNRPGARSFDLWRGHHMNGSQRAPLRMCRVGAAWGIAAAAVFAGAAQAQPPSAETGTLSILFENDIFYHTDRDYTNGVQIAWTTAPDDTPDWAIDAARLIPFFGQSGEVLTTYAIGQNIYTPSNLHLVDPPLTDRPYAGYLYLAMGVIQKTETDLDEFQVQLGVVGPDSLAEESQKFVHSILNDTIPKGWGTQLHNEPGLIINAEHSWRAIATGSLLGFSFDIDPHV